MKDEKLITEKVQFNYFNQTTKYYQLTESSGYPSAEFQFAGAAKKGTGLVITETRSDSANPTFRSH